MAPVPALYAVTGPRPVRTISDPAFQNAAIIGGGAWGTALSMVSARAGLQTRLWMRAPHTALHVGQTRVSSYLDGIRIPEEIAVTACLEQALQGAGLVFLVVPSQALRIVARRCAPLLAPGACVLLCSKGIEKETGLLMSEVASQEIPDRPVAVLSGPSFATEVAAGKPAAVTVAIGTQAGGGLHASRRLGSRLERALHSPSFRIQLSADPAGVEVAGAMKNVIAIACGIASGRQLGANFRATLITQGLSEMRDLTIAIGGNPETAGGLAGIGDLVLTCCDPQSRNFSLGLALGAGEAPAPRLAERPRLTEGAVNVESVLELARRHGVRLPVCSFVDDILHRGLSIEQALPTLLAQPLEPQNANPFRASGEGLAR